MNDAFLQPLAGLAANSPQIYPCPENSDADWLRLGIARVLEQVESGRAFLQEHGPRFYYQPTRASYFVAQNRARRLRLVRDVYRRLLVRAQVPDQLAPFPKLPQGDFVWVTGTGFGRLK